jgi:hypothetical protein
MSYGGHRPTPRPHHANRRRRGAVVHSVGRTGDDEPAIEKQAPYLLSEIGAVVISLVSSSDNMGLLGSVGH